MDIDFSKKKTEASNFRKDGEFIPAIKIYKDLWKNHRSLCNEWEGWGYAKCLKSIGETNKALEICRQYYPLNNKFDLGNNLYAWCIYETSIKIDQNQISENETTFFKAVQAVITLVDQELHTPYSKTILKTCEYLNKSKKKFPAETILNWLNFLSVDLLPSEEYTFKDKSDKNISIASEKEKFYMLKSKAQEQMGFHNDCIKLCKEALHTIEPFHYNDDLWLKRRLGVCYQKTNNHEKALSIFQSVLKQKDDWFVLFDISKSYFHLNNLDDALIHSIRAALSKGQIGYKWELFFHMATIYKELNESTLSKNHAVLSQKIREDNNWKVPDELKTLIKSMDINFDDYKSTQRLYIQLIKQWDSYLTKSSNYFKGTIKNILANGKAGFINQSENNVDYYFSFRDSHIKKWDMKKGIKVMFLTKGSFDKKKQKDSVVAYEIRELT